MNFKVTLQSHFDLKLSTYNWIHPRLKKKMQLDVGNEPYLSQQ